MEVYAIQKFVRTSPKKLRDLAFQIKKLKPNHAMAVLPHVKTRGAEVLQKVIGSALGNARVLKLSDSDLSFKEVQINEAPRLKRFRAGARGRVKPYKRAMSHIRVVLTTRESKSQNPKSGIVEQKEGKVDKKKEEKI